MIRVTNPQNPSQNPSSNAGGNENQTAVWNTSGNNGGSNPNQYGSGYGAPQGQPGGYGQPGQQGAYGQAGAYGQPNQNMFQQQPKKSKLWLKVLIGFLLVIVLLLLLAEFGLRWFMKDQIQSAFREQQQESGVSEPVDAEISLGASPLLLGIVQGKIPQMTVDIPSTLDITYEGQDKSKPRVTGEPAVHLELRDTQMDTDNPDDAVVGDLRLRTVITKEMLLAQASESASDGGGDEDNPLAGLLQITDVRPNPDKQTLSFDLTGGLATFEVKPVIQGGQMKMEMENVSLLGMDLPESFTQEMESQLEDSIPADVQGGMDFESINVTDEGLEVNMHGTDVNFAELDTGSATGGSSDGSGSGSGSDGGNGSGGSGGSDSGNTEDADLTRPWKEDGPVGSSEMAA
nr:DUF2993 domain-containing protein [Corynebacterium sp. ACRPH]